MRQAILLIVGETEGDESPLWLGVLGVIEEVKGNPHLSLTVGDTRAPILVLLYTTARPSVPSPGLDIASLG